MKKFFTLFAALLLSVMTYSYAEVISPNDAKAAVEAVLSLDEEWQSSGDAQIRLVEHNGIPVYYVIEYAQGGWVIASAQSSSSPLIAYNHTGVYEAPVPMQDMLDISATCIAYRAVNEEVEHQGWKRAIQRMPAADVNTTPDIAPIITINLNQSNPYNKYCPKMDNKNCLVGCVAVAMTQAMMVQRYPDRAVGSNTYVDENVGKLSINYDNEPAYDWDAILSCDETGDYDEVARMLYHAGVSINMMYSLSFSGAFMDDAVKSLRDHFQYDPEKLRLVFRYEHSDADWYDMILTDLLLGRAVLYQGAATEDGQGGHCWNIDGWKKSTQMVHCNWGWGGSGDGYFNLDNMTDSYQGISFLYHHGAILGVGVPTTAPYGISLSTTKFVAGTAAGVALADVKVSCEDEEAEIVYEIKGAKNVLGVHTASPYSVVDGKLVSNKTIEDTNAFKYMLMKVTNNHTGESFEKEFSIQIVQTNAVDAVMSNALRVYPSVADNYVTVEAPVAGGEYAIYSVAGAQVAAGHIDGYKADIDVASLAAGTYILRYTHSEGVGVKTFIKK